MYLPSVQGNIYRGQLRCRYNIIIMPHKYYYMYAHAPRLGRHAGAGTGGVGRGPDLARSHGDRRGVDARATLLPVVFHRPGRGDDSDPICARANRRRGCPRTYNFRTTSLVTIDVDGYRPFKVFCGQVCGAIAGKDWGTPVPGSKMYHAAPPPRGASSANPPKVNRRRAFCFPGPCCQGSRVGFFKFATGVTPGGCGGGYGPQANPPPSALRAVPSRSTYAVFVFQ